MTSQSGRRLGGPGPENQSCITSSDNRGTQHNLDNFIIMCLCSYSIAYYDGDIAIQRLMKARLNIVLDKKN